MQTANLQFPDATKALFATLCAAYPGIAKQLAECLTVTPAASSADFPNAAPLVSKEEEMGQTLPPLADLIVQQKEFWAPPPAFPPLESVTRPTVPTEQAAYYLERRPQTLRGWACHEDGPLRPMRVNSRLHWRTEDIRRLLGVS